MLKIGFILLVLLLPTVYFCYKYHYDFDGVQKIQKYPVATKLAALLLLCYLSLFVIFGAEVIESHLASTRKLRQLFTYLLPSIGFGLAIFPSEEFRVSTKTVSILGWFILTVVSIKALPFSI